MLWNVFRWKWANLSTVLGRLVGSCLLCQLSFYGNIHKRNIQWISEEEKKKLISGVSGFDIFNRSVTLSISRKSDCLSGNMLFSGWLCVRCWTWCWGFRFVSRTVSTAQSTERLTDDFNHNSGNFMFIQQMCIKDE